MLAICLVSSNSLPLELTRPYHDKFNFFGNLWRELKIRHRNWKGILALAALLGVAGYFIWDQVRQGGFDPAVFWSTLRRLDPGWMALSFAFALATYAGRALRWAVLIRPVVPRPNMAGLVADTAIGFTAITLLGRPGELVRPYLIGRRTGTSFSYQVAALMLERIFDLLAALLVFGFGLSQLQTSALEVGPGLDWVLRRGGQMVAGLGLACVATILFAKYYSNGFRRVGQRAIGFLPQRLQPSVTALLDAFFDGMQALRSGSALLQMLLYTALEWLLIWLTFFCVIKAFPALGSFSAMNILVFMGFVAFGAVVQIPGIGGGVQVVGFLVLTELFGTAVELASSVALVLWFVTFIVIVPFGAVLAFRQGIHWDKLRHVQQEAP
jgi:hypothetical protein